MTRPVISDADIRPISALSLPHFLKAALAEAGYKTIHDVSQVDSGDLCAELGIGVAQAEDILRQGENSRGPLQHPAPPYPAQAPTQHGGPPSSAHPVHSSTAAELLSTASLPHFSTLSSSLDRLISRFSPRPDDPRNGNVQSKGRGRMLGGSIIPGMTLELSGPPGGGKTAIAVGIGLSARLRLHVRDAEIDEQTDGSNMGEVLIVGKLSVIVLVKAEKARRIDTEGGITPDRVYKAAVSLTLTSSVSPRSVIRGIHLIRIATQVQMIAFLITMDDWLDEHPRVNLVIIDTLSFHFRQPTLDMKTRARFMELVRQKIGSATAVHQCAVIVTNQLATKLLTADNKPANFDTGDRAVLMPQLGDSWTTAKTVRIVLFRGGPGDDMRYAHASTTSGGNENIPWASFDIGSDGVPCDVPESPDRPDVYDNDLDHVHAS